MPLREDLKLLFVHIPRTGGTAIERYFRMQRKERFYVPEYTHIVNGVHFSPQHFTADILKRHIPDYDHYFKFTFVRHPITKALSTYMNLERPRIFTPQKFDQWCHSFYEIMDVDHKLPQTDYLDDQIAFIGRYERFREDFRELACRFKRRPLFSPFRLNRSRFNKESLRLSVLPQTNRFLRVIFKHDFDRFGYEI